MEALRKEWATSSQLPDNQVIARILSGEKEWFEILLRRYNQTLYRAIRSYLKDENDVKDTMQEAYVKAYRKLEQFRGDAAFSTWLVRIGINEALLHIRKQKRQNIVSIFGNSDKEQSEMEQLADYQSSNPEKTVMSKENQQLLEQAIDLLPQKYKIVYMLREIEQMSHHEIADSLELSESNVKVRFHRAKSLLKDHLLKLSDDTKIFQFGNEHCDQMVAKVMARI